MENIDREKFLNESVQTLNSLIEIMQNLPEIELNKFEASKTALIIIDIINGFVKEGALKSTRVESIVPEISKLMKRCIGQNIPVLAFADCHSNESPEFDFYPAHCIRGTYESEVVEEIKDIGRYELIPKNSTNGFLEDQFQEWLKKHTDIKNYIVVGDCTDICIMQFVLTLKAYFNMKNIKADIYVPKDAVDTFDLNPHNGDLMNIFALYTMMANGIRVIKSIK